MVCRVLYIVFEELGFEFVITNYELWRSHGRVGNIQSVPQLKMEGQLISLSNVRSELEVVVDIGYIGQPSPSWVAYSLGAANSLSGPAPYIANPLLGVSHLHSEKSGGILESTMLRFLPGIFGDGERI